MIIRATELYRDHPQSPEDELKFFMKKEKNG